MIIAVDPDVFVASLTDGNCAQLVLQIRNNLDELRIVVDDKGQILKEYGDFLLSHFDEEEEHLTIKLLQEILFDKEKVILPLPTSISSSLQTLLNKRRCTTPLEPELISVAANAEHLGLKLLLAGTGINARLRHRGLNDPQVRRAIRKEIPWLEVHFASDRKELFAPPLIIHEKARTFEYMVAIKLQTQHPTLRCVETPDGVKNQLKKQEDVDLYGYEEDDDTLFVWVGECKLREEGSSRSSVRRKRANRSEPQICNNCPREWKRAVNMSRADPI